MTKNHDDVATTLALNKSASPWRRRLLIILALAIILILVLFGTSVSERSKEPEYVTAKATIADFDVIVTATGTVEPTNLVEISSELSGTLDKVHVDYNDTVKVGTILATLDTTKLEAELAISRASLDASIARVAMAQATLKEARDVYRAAQTPEERGVTAHQAFVAQEARYARAEAELTSAIADRSLAEANLDLHQAEFDKACICSPVDGIILNRAADPGQIVASALSAPVLFTVAEDLKQMELRVDIDEADIGQVSVGQAAEFTVDAYDDRRFPARIVQVRFAPETVDGVVTYKAILTIDNADLSLRSGMTANADITVAEIKSSLVVPNAALRYAPPRIVNDKEASKERSGLLGMLIPDAQDSGLSRADNRTVWVLDAEGPREVTITPGASDGSVTAILAGELENGDLIITEQIDE